MAEAPVLFVVRYQQRVVFCPMSRVSDRRLSFYWLDPLDDSAVDSLCFRCLQRFRFDECLRKSVKFPSFVTISFRFRFRFRLFLNFFSLFTRTFLSRFNKLGDTYVWRSFRLTCFASMSIPSFRTFSCSANLSTEIKKKKTRFFSSVSNK